jgi:hypothetical protein
MTKYYILFGADGVLITRLVDSKDNIPEEAIEVEYDFWAHTAQDDSGIWMLNADGTITLHPFPPHVPSPEEVLASQSAKLQGFKQVAEAQKVALAARIGVLNDAIELEEATPAEIAELPLRQAQLLEWKRYAIYLGRVTTQAGWPPDAVWPVQPVGGMDLTVSASAPDLA